MMYQNFEPGLHEPHSALPAMIVGSAVSLLLWNLLGRLVVWALAA